MSPTGGFIQVHICMNWLTKWLERSKRSCFPNRPSTERVKPRGPSLNTTNPNVYHRPLSALCRHKLRELSDIREVSGSSKESTVRRSLSRLLDGTNDGKVPKPASQSPSQKGADIDDTSDDTPRSRPLPSPRGLGNRAPSAVSLPIKDVPERRSSASFLTKASATSRRSSVHDFAACKSRPPSAAGEIIPARARASSPVREALRRDPVSSDAQGRSPSKTFVRTAPPLDILDLSNIRYERVEMNLQTSAPLFVGGGTIEGKVSLIVDGGSGRKTKLNPLFISRLSVDVVGVEEVSDGRRWIFLSLASELLDEQHPPPASLVATQIPTLGPELSWALEASTAVIPFCLNLPLTIGPPPYISKQARIRYILCATACVKPAGDPVRIRQSLDVHMLTVYDPEKALSSLPTPLLATEQLSIPHGLGKQNIKLTAGLHRQIWLNGAMIFVDVHIMNHSSKTLKKIEVQLEKTTLWYSHAAAGTIEKSATHLRLPKRSDNEIVCSSIIKTSKEWKGVPSHSSEVRTCDIEIPRGHVTISTGRYFEVRYFLNVIVAVTLFKTIAVQLPVTIIPLNSLDVVPNCLAQVAASIEAKRLRTVPSNDQAIYPAFRPGQAFTAPRRQSLEQMRRASGELGMDDLAALTHDLDCSPRRFARACSHGHREKRAKSMARSEENHPASRVCAAPSSHHHHIRQDSCYHCHLQDMNHRQHFRHKGSMSSLPGPKLPRLQLSTSGLGFSDSEFEMANDSPPRKVMLSESERKLIQQQRELRLQRQLVHQPVRRRPSLNQSGARIEETDKQRGPAAGHWGWRNVAAQPMAAAAGHGGPGHGGHAYVKAKVADKGELESIRPRSNTGPSRLGMSGPSMSISVPHQGQRRAKRSMDHGLTRASGERMRGPSAAVGGGGMEGRGFRKSVENW